MFENNGDIHVYSPGEDSPRGSKCFRKYKNSVHLDICCKVLSIK